MWGVKLHHNFLGTRPSQLIGGTEEDYLFFKLLLKRAHDSLLEFSTERAAEGKTGHPMSDAYW